MLYNISLYYYILYAVCILLYYIIVYVLRSIGIVDCMFISVV